MFALIIKTTHIRKKTSNMKSSKQNDNSETIPKWKPFKDFSRTWIDFGLWIYLLAVLYPCRSVIPTHIPMNMTWSTPSILFIKHACQNFIETKQETNIYLKVLNIMLFLNIHH